MKGDIMVMNRLRRRSTETLFGLACCIALISRAFEAEAAVLDPENRAVEFLYECGYLSPVDSRTEGNISGEDISKAIAKFQCRIGVEATGNLDAKTFSLMRVPGCGNPDIIGSNPGSRSKRDADPGPGCPGPAGPPGNPGYPGYPGFPGYPGYPGR